MCEIHHVEEWAERTRRGGAERDRVGVQAQKDGLGRPNHVQTRGRDGGFTIRLGVGSKSRERDEGLDLGFSAGFGASCASRLFGVSHHVFLTKGRSLFPRHPSPSPLFFSLQRRWVACTPRPAFKASSAASTASAPTLPSSRSTVWPTRKRLSSTLARSVPLWIFLARLFCSVPCVSRVLKHGKCRFTTAHRVRLQGPTADQRVKGPCDLGKGDEVARSVSSWGRRTEAPLKIGPFAHTSRLCQATLGPSGPSSAPTCPLVLSALPAEWCVWRPLDKPSVLRSRCE
jgi:hypothetical protein